MKEFECRRMGHSCDEVLTARTEERLADLVSVHLREAHAVSSISPEAVAKIKNLFVNRATEDAANVADGIFEKYNCSGEPECTWRYIAEAEMILNGGKLTHEHELQAA